MKVAAIRPSTLTQSWLGPLALLLALVSALTFIAFMSHAGQVPKAIAHQPNLLFEVYSQSPLISSSAGAASVVVALLALRRVSAPVWASIVGAIVGIALFNAVMVVAAQVMPPPTSVPIGGNELSMPGFPTIALNPPAIAMTVLIIGVAAVLPWMRGAAGHRPAIGALILGGAAAFYWLSNLVWSINAE